MLFTTTMRRALATLEIQPEDEAAKELALIYAERIEAARKAGNSKTIAELGPKLTTLLGELLMTPKARAAIRTTIKEVATTNDPDDAASVLKELQSDPW